MNSNYGIPKSAAGIGQVFIQLEGMKKKDALFHLVTKDYKQVNLWVQLKSGLQVLHRFFILPLHGVGHAETELGVVAVGVSLDHVGEFPDGVVDLAVVEKNVTQLDVGLAEAGV